MNHGLRHRFLVWVRHEYRAWRGEFLPLLFPPACPGCGCGASRPDALCAACLAGLLVRRGSLCLRCGELAPRPSQPCHGCGRRRRSLAWVRVPLAYVGTGGSLVRRLKFQRRTDAGRFLARLMARHLREHGPVDLREYQLVPIPVDPLRRKRRGFDQAEWLCRALAGCLGLPAPARVLVRVRPTLPQGDVRVLSRLRNVAGAFAPGPGARVKGRKILLVDDVTTSGATAAECSSVLRRVGAASVALVCACRGSLPAGRDNP